MQEHWQRRLASLSPEDAAVKNRLTSGELRKHLTARLRAMEADGIPVRTLRPAEVARQYTAQHLAELQRQAHWTSDWTLPNFRR